MSRPKEWKSELAAYLLSCKRKHLNPRTIREYELANIHIWQDCLVPAGYKRTIDIDEEAVDLVLCYIGDMAWKFDRWQRFIGWCGNRVIEDMGIRFPGHQKWQADWLNPQELSICITALGDLPESMMHHKMIFYLELFCMYRRIEVKQARVEYFHQDGTMTIHGKGRMGGKFRTIPTPPSLYPILHQYLTWRQENIVMELEDPGQLITYRKGGEVRTYKDTSLDNKLKELVEYFKQYDSNITFTHHTLRRTGAREAWKAGVPIVVIQKILGHSNIETTMRYIGINIEDMSTATETIDRHLLAMSRPIPEKTGVSVAVRKV